MSVLARHVGPASLVMAVIAWGGARAVEPSPPEVRTAPVCGRDAGSDAGWSDVWAKVAARSCLNCHREGGDAEASAFVLVDPERRPATERADVHRRNRSIFEATARRTSDGRPLVLEKVVGRLDHGGEDVLPADSPGYRVLRDFVAAVRRGTDAATPLPGPSPPSGGGDADDRPFLDGVTMLDDGRLLRRVTLSLAGRLPTDAERHAIESGGLEALPGLLDGILAEEAFYDRLREAFNDVFLTVGYDGNAETALSYEHFSKTRHWYQSHDLSSVGDKAAQQKARYKLADDYRAALKGEPMKLVEHIVREGRPFTEIVTADYVMVTPYTARGYGVYDELKSRFRDPDDPFEYIPVRLKALVGRSKSQNQPSETGFYPHAGLLTTFQYLRRYPTTETNRNRLRARMIYQQFLGVDALELAARVSDAAAVTAKFKTPTMEAAECVVCHRTIDPVAGLFQDYYDIEGVYGRRKDGWYEDMFAAGFEGADLPSEDIWRAPAWLGGQIAGDPRFATTMVEHVYYLLTGRRVLLPPRDLADPAFDARRRGYEYQRQAVAAVTERFVAEDYDLKTAIKAWVVTDLYRADGLAAIVDDPDRGAELADVGVVRMLSPEQVERKIAAVFGERWGKLEGELAMLYGGIDSQEVTERAADPSGAMGAIQRLMSNDVACRHTLSDFALPPAQRRLFAEVEPDVRPGASAAADAAIRRTIVRLHERILGTRESPDSPDVERTYKLLAEIVADAHARGSFDPREIYQARRDRGDVPSDPEYMIRAWRGVVTYLIRRQEFLYE